MICIVRCFVVVLVTLIVCDAHSSPVRSRAQDHGTSPTSYVPVDNYNPKRNAAQDITDAIVEASHTGRRVLLEVGGKWCSWCHTMDRFFEQNPALLALREQNYVTVKINFSPENENKPVLRSYPPIPGYPHIFILDSDGKLLRSQDTGELELGRSYDLTRFSSFLKQWAR